MDFPTWAPVVVVLACANPEGVAQGCTALAADTPVVNTREIFVCELRTKVSRQNGTAAFEASCARGARMETRGVPLEGRVDRDATVVAAVFY